MYKLIKSILIVLGLMLGSASYLLADCTLINATSGWTGQVAFKCDKTIDLSKSPVSFSLSNNVTITSMWGVDDIRFQQDENKVIVQAFKWWPKNSPYILPAQKVAKINFSPSNNNFVISNFQVGQKKPLSEAVVEIQLPKKPAYITDGKLATVMIQKNGQVVAVVSKQSWGKLISIPVRFSEKQADFTVFVPDLDGSKGYAVPESFALRSNQTQKVDISYRKPAPKETGSLQLNVQLKGAGVKNFKASYQLSKDHVTVRQGEIDEGSNIINQIPSSKEGVQYVLNLPEFIQQGVLYKPEKSQYNVTVITNMTTPLNVVYTAMEVPKFTLSFNVKGLPKEATVDFSLTSISGSKKSVPIHGDGHYQITLPRDGSIWNIQAPSYNQYVAQLSTASVIANIKTQTIEVTYKEQAPKVALMPFKDISYNMIWSTNPASSNLKEIADNSGQYSYILAFVTQDAWSKSCSPAWAGQPSLALDKKLYLSDINYLKAKGGKIGISFGGENGGSVAKKCNLADVEKAYQLAIEIYKPWMIDFDIEGGALSDKDANTRRLDALKALMKTYPDLRISLTLPANIDGFNPLGLAIIKEAKEKGVPIYEYNMMTMAWYAQKLPGDISKSVIAAVDKGLKQLQGIFPSISKEILLSKIRVTPRIGLDYDGSVLYPKDAIVIGNFAKQQALAGVSFWSADVDRNQNKSGNCNQGVSPDCSSIKQDPYDFTKAFLAGLRED